MYSLILSSRVSATLTTTILNASKLPISPQIDLFRRLFPSWESYVKDQCIENESHFTPMLLGNWSARNPVRKKLRISLIHLNSVPSRSIKALSPHQSPQSHHYNSLFSLVFIQTGFAPRLYKPPRLGWLLCWLAFCSRYCAANVVEGFYVEDRCRFNPEPRLCLVKPFFI